MIDGLSPEETRDLILSVGTHLAFRPLTPIEVGQYFQRALDAGVSREEIATRCLLDRRTSMIGRFTSLLQLAPELHHLVVFGSVDDSLGFTQAMEISKLKNHEHQTALAQSTLENRIPKDEIRSICQLIKRSGTEVQQAVEETLRLRPEIDQIWIYAGIVDDERVSERLSGLTQVARDQIFGEILREVGFEGSGHLGPERFTVSAESPPVSFGGAEQLEEAVNKRLALVKDE